MKSIKMNTKDHLQDQGASNTTMHNPILYGSNVTSTSTSSQSNVQFPSLPTMNGIASVDSATSATNGLIPAPVSSSSSSSSSTMHRALTFPSHGSTGQTNESLLNNSRPHSRSDVRKSTNDEAVSGIVQLARRRRSSRSKEKQQQQRKNCILTRPQGRPLSKETRVRLTLVPTLGILYSILVSDTMRKTLKVLKYSNEVNSFSNTNEELSTRNVISGFSSLLNVKTARFSEDGMNYSPHQINAATPKFNSIDEAVFHLFGLNEYTLVRVSRAAATEIGGSVLLKIETAMPGYLYLNDDEDEDFKTVEENQDLYYEAIGSKGDRPSTTFLKKKVARPRYKSDMRIYIIPRINSCAIYCEKRMFKRDLLRGFLDMRKLDRSIIVAFDYEEVVEELKRESKGGLINEMNLPTIEEFKNAVQAPANSYPVQPVELSISKQSALQHLQHVQYNQLQHPHMPLQQQQQLYQQQHPQPYQLQQAPSSYYNGFSIPRQSEPNEAPVYDMSSQSRPLSNISYGHPQTSSIQVYQIPAHHQEIPSSSQHSSQYQTQQPPPPSQMQTIQANSFLPPSYNAYSYQPEMDSSNQTSFSQPDQAFIQQPSFSEVHDPNRSRSVSQFQQPPRFYNPPQQAQLMFPSQTMNLQMPGHMPPLQQPSSQYTSNQHPNQSQDPNASFHYS